MRDRHTELKVLPQDNGEEFFSDYLFAQRQRNTVFGKHDTNSRCQCNKCAANPEPLPHIKEGIEHAATIEATIKFESEESSFGAMDTTFDDELAATQPPTVASDATCLEYFRRHQELNRVVPPCISIIPRQTIFSPFFVGSSAFMPTAPIPVFHAPAAQNVFAFPYVPTFQKEQPKRKYKNHKKHEIEFQCACEKERVLS
jgi:hypothetical protein